MKELTEKALTVMQELTTPVGPATTPMLLSQAMLRFQSFQTFHEPLLERALVEAESFVQSFLSSESEPRWLSFVGNSGTGKTFLATQVYVAARTCGRLTAINHQIGVLSPVRKIFWPTLLTKLREGEYWLLNELSDCSFVFLDEIAVEHDPSGFARDKLCELLSRRVRGWTLLTSNLSLEKLGEIDTRIPSRMIRDGSVTVEMNTQDFSLRSRSL